MSTTERATGGGRGALAALAGGLVLAGCAHAPAHRYFQPSAGQAGAYPNSYGQMVVPRHGLIVVQGDDFAYGLGPGRARHRINGAEGGQAGLTISQSLRRAVKDVRVENRGFPGDTAVQSAVRWEQAATPDLLILCLGYGDLAAHTRLEDFREAVAGLIAQEQAAGSGVMLVLPPRFATRDPRLKFAGDRLNTYRDAMRELARTSGAEVFDAEDSMGRIKAPPLSSAAEPPAVYQAVAADLAPYIRVVDAPSATSGGAPQTGQAGSGDSRTVRASPASAS